MTGVYRESDHAERSSAHMVFKQVKAGVKGTEDLTPEEFGLLYIHYPFVLPDVDRGDGDG